LLELGVPAPNKGILLPKLLILPPKLQTHILDLEVISVNFVDLAKQSPMVILHLLQNRIEEVCRICYPGGGRDQARRRHRHRHRSRGWDGAMNRGRGREGHVSRLRILFPVATQM
jgi:hypothetical protein